MSERSPKKEKDLLIPPSELSGLAPDAPILVGFSGGADSSALLHMLKCYSERTGARIFAAHINHGIRGKEADRDEEFCKRVCESYGIELFVLHADVPAIAEKTGKSIETAAREVRYEFFDSLMEKNSIPLLATAHNANDNLETMLFNLARGCGLGGMCGIPSARECSRGTVIRPIIKLEREEILAYCESNSISFVTDSTNLDTEYTRNKIRAEIIPALKKVNPSAVKNASRLSDLLRADSLCLSGMADWFLSESKRGTSVEIERLIGSPDAVSDRAMISLFEEVSGGASLEQVHILALRELCRRAIPHSSLDLPSGVRASVEGGWLVFSQGPAQKYEIDDYSAFLTEGKNVISQIKAEIIIGNSHNEINIYKNSTLYRLDSAKINGALYARNRRAGDKIRIGGMSKSIKKMLCDKKIPLDLRARIPVICDSERIVAVPFLGICDDVKIREGTAKPLTIDFLLH